MRKLILLAAAAAAMMASACNTIEGAGRDLGKAGEAISRTANEVKN
jgi:predicted small secreted protein